MTARDDRAADAALRRVVRKLHRIAVDMEEMGQNDMGWLHLRLARRFHRATDSVRRLAVELTQDVAWPHEPGDFGEPAP